MKTFQLLRASVLPALLRPLAVASVAALAAALPARAQQEPLMGVDVNSISVLAGQGGVVQVRIMDGGAGYASAPAVTISGGGGTGATAIATVTNGAVTGLTLTNAGTGYTSLPTIAIGAPNGGTQATAGTATVNNGAVTGVSLSSGGSGYVAAPAVTITGGGGTGATATATVTNGSVSAITITTGGTGYTSAPSIAIAAPGSQATAVATQLGQVFSAPFQNESYGPYNTTILINAQAHGTFPAGGYNYTFYVNGTPLGSIPGLPEGTPAIGPWSPPQPGAYQITVTATDGTHTATSLAVRYFATGTQIISPVDNTLVPNGSSVVVQATAVPPPSGTNAFVQRVEFYVDGTLYDTDYNYPYSTIYTPSTTVASHTIEARAYDNNGNLVSPAGTAVRTIKMIPAIGSSPGSTTTSTYVHLLNPLDNTSVSSGTAVKIIADAVAPAGFIKNVNFYVNGVVVGSSNTFPFTATWTSQVPGKYQFVAIASDDKGNAVASERANVTVTGGFPTIALTQPSSATTVIQGVPLSVSVNAAGADGGIASLSRIDLLVDGNVTDSLPKNPLGLVPPPVLTEPFVFTWNSNVTLGQHKLAARVTDANGISITSPEIPVTVIANQLPSISITSPPDGASASVNAAITITTNPTDPDGSVASVEFFLNGTSMGDPVKAPPYQWNWTPKAAGAYVLTAKVTDNAGGTKTSAPVNITVTDASAGGSSAATNTVYRGSYGSTTENGQFSLGVNRTGRGTFVAYSTSPTGKTYYWSDFPVASDGTFKVQDNSGNTLISGQTNPTGVVGSFGDKTFIGPVSIGTTPPLILSGALSGSSASTVTALVGADGQITVYSANGSKADAGTGTISSTGAYSIPAQNTTNGGTFSGMVATQTASVSGTVTGGTAGSFQLAQVPSRLINLSTLTTAGSGQATLVAGFGISGSGTKPLLIRAVGPTLATFNVPNYLADPTLQVVTQASNASVGSNDNWTSAVSAATSSVGAFALAAGSKDAALTVSLAPGGYSAVVGGSSAAPGAAMLEIYDTQPVATGTARLNNLSARALLAPTDSLTAGFVIGGDTKKKLLIRAIGPSLANFGITNPFDDPKLTLYTGSTALVTNENWSGTDVTTGAAAVNAFPLVAGSKDAAAVVTLSPGSYTVQVTGTSAAAGVVLVEIYDLDP